MVITGLPVGGAETVTVQLADRLVALGHVVSIFMITGEALMRPQSPDIRIIRIGMRKTPWGVLAGFGRLCRMLAAFKPDVVHSHMFHANLLSRLARLRVTLPRLICTAHSSNEGGHLHMLAYRLTHRLADVTTNVSDEAVTCFEQRGAVPSAGMLTVYNSIDTDIYRPDDTDRAQIRASLHVMDSQPVFLAVGRLTAAKNYPLLLQAFRRVVAQLPSARLWVAGTGELEDSLHVERERLGLTDQVSFLGRRRDIPALLNAADVFVQASDWEGLSMAVGEAMASGLPAVVTDAGGMRELVDGHGWVLPTGDGDGLANGMLEAIKAVGTGAHDAAAARAHIKSRFGVQQVLARWLDIYGADRSP